MRTSYKYNACQSTERDTSIWSAIGVYRRRHSSATTDMRSVRSFTTTGKAPTKCKKSFNNDLSRSSYVPWPRLPFPIRLKLFRAAELPRGILLAVGTMSTNEAVRTPVCFFPSAQTPTFHRRDHRSLTPRHHIPVELWDGMTRSVEHWRELLTRPTVAVSF